MGLGRQVRPPGTSVGERDQLDTVARMKDDSFSEVARCHLQRSGCSLSLLRREVAKGDARDDEAVHRCRFG